MNSYVPIDRAWLRKKLELEPTGDHQSAIVNSDGRFIMVSGGEQGGKSWGVAWLCFERSFEFPFPIIIWLVGRRYYDTRKEYEYLLQFYSAFGWVKKASVAQADKKREIELVDGTVIRTMSVAETMNISQESPQIILGCEAAQMSMEAYYKLEIRARAGKGYLILSGTVEKLSWFKQFFQQWSANIGERRAYSLPSYTNTHIFEYGKEDPEIQALRDVLPPDLFAERIEGTPRKMSGLVFGNDFDPELHIRDVDFDPELPVHYCIDPGYNQAVHALVAIQIAPSGMIQVFDEIYRNDYLVHDLAQEAQSREWWANVGDGFHVIDVAGTRHLHPDAPPAETWSKLTGAYLHSDRVGIMDGIERMKLTLRPNRFNKAKIVFSPRCKGILSEFGMCESPISGKIAPYRWKIGNEGDIEGKTPMDRNNDAIKALTYWLYIKYGLVDVSLLPQVAKRTRKRNKARKSPW